MFIHIYYIFFSHYVLYHSTRKHTDRVNFSLRELLAALVQEYSVTNTRGAAARQLERWTERIRVRMHLLPLGNLRSWVHVTIVVPFERDTKYR